ncbi:hypothetical protein DFJ58DRAFT_775578, partial [Suillus subalutaceus]|uniref:uncharacterized protein n=1 Tax=Suillus subalutaceus TaxID=48586 RepID=UPI001B85E6DD
MISMSGSSTTHLMTFIPYDIFMTLTSDTFLFIVRPMSLLHTPFSPFSVLFIVRPASFLQHILLQPLSLFYDTPHATFTLVPMLPYALCYFFLYAM